jgi:hypothetical protein
MTRQRNRQWTQWDQAGRLAEHIRREIIRLNLDRWLAGVAKELHAKAVHKEVRDFRQPSVSRSIVGRQSMITFPVARVDGLKFKRWIDFGIFTDGSSTWLEVAWDGEESSLPLELLDSEETREILLRAAVHPKQTAL